MKIGIIGLGLIGGSLGLEFKAAGLEVVGVSRQQSTCEIAVEKKAVDRAGTNLEILSNTDIIFICTPIALIAPTVQQLIPHLKPETILTDVGSVKGEIVRAIAPLWPNFIGGHPMAGTAEQGIGAAFLGLFKNAPYVLTPTALTPKHTIEKLKELIQILGSRYYECSPEIHDQAVAWISHLPVYISTNLITSCLSETDPKVLEMAQYLASSGFKDTSRVGGGNPELGLMMAQGNRTALLKSLRSYQDNLTQIIAQIKSENWPAIAECLTKNQQERSKFVD